MLLSRIVFLENTTHIVYLTNFQNSVLQYFNIFFEWNGQNLCLFIWQRFVLNLFSKYIYFNSGAVFCRLHPLTLYPVKVLLRMDMHESFSMCIFPCEIQWHFRDDLDYILHWRLGHLVVLKYLNLFCMEHNENINRVHLGTTTRSNKTKTRTKKHKNIEWQ